MGSNLTKPHNTLYNKIREEVRTLIFKYDFWTHEDICDKLTLVYYDKLIQFKKSDLLDASAYIGIKHDGLEREELCEQIIQHYKKRIDLLKLIWDAVDRGHQRVTQAREGPICRNVNKYVDEFFECEKMQGLWLNKEQYNQIINRLKELNIYGNWISHIQGLENKWKKYMSYLYKVIKSIRDDVDNTMDDDMFEELRKTSRLVITKMDYVCDIYYLLTINYG
jgi:hypothetical protein